MGVISRLYTFVNGAGNKIDAPQVNAELDQILGVLNGNIEAANIKDAVVTSQKLKPTVALVKQTSDLTLGTSLADVTGATTTLTIATSSVIFVTAVFNFRHYLANTETITMTGKVNIDGSDATQSAVLMYGSPGGEGSTRNQQATVAVNASANVSAGSRVVKLRAQYSGSLVGGFTPIVLAANTNFIVTVISQ